MTIVTCVLLTVSTLPALARTWTDRTGNFRIQAELVTVKNGKVYLERESGSVSAVPLERLSTDDLRHLSSFPEHKAAVAPFLASDANAKTSSDAAKTPAKTVSPKMATISIGDAFQSGEIRRFDSPSWGYKGLAFSRNGAYLVALGHDNVTVFDVEHATDVVYKIDDQDTSYRTCLTFSPDGKRLFAGSFKGVVLIWNFDKRGRLTPEKRVPIHDSQVHSISIAPDNKHALSIESRHIARLWNIETGNEVSGYEGFDVASNGTTFITPKGGQGLVSDGKTLALIELPGGTLVQTMQLARSRGQCIAVSPDGLHVAVNDTYAMRIWETTTGKQLPVLQDKEIQWSTDFSPSGQLLASGGNSRITIWDIETGRKVKVFNAGKSGYVHHLTFSPDGIHLAAVVGPIGQTIQVFRLPPIAP